MCFQSHHLIVETECQETIELCCKQEFNKFRIFKDAFSSDVYNFMAGRTERTH